MRWAYFSSKNCLVTSKQMLSNLVTSSSESCVGRMGEKKGDMVVMVVWIRLGVDPMGTEWPLGTGEHKGTCTGSKTVHLPGTTPWSALSYKKSEEAGGTAVDEVTTSTLLQPWNNYYNPLKKDRGTTPGQKPNPLCPIQYTLQDSQGNFNIQRGQTSSLLWSV